MLRAVSGGSGSGAGTPPDDLIATVLTAGPHFNDCYRAGRSTSRTTLASLERVVELRSLSSAPGRVCEITNGRFVEAKQEKRWLAVRPLWSNPAGRLGRE